MSIAALVMIVFMGAMLGVALLICSVQENFLSAFIFAVLLLAACVYGAVWAMGASNENNFVAETTSHKVHIINNVAYAQTGDEMENLNAKFDRQFEEGEEVWITHYPAQWVRSLWFEESYEIFLENPEN